MPESFSPRHTYLGQYLIIELINQFSHNHGWEMFKSNSPGLGIATSCVIDFPRMHYIEPHIPTTDLFNFLPQ